MSKIQQSSSSSQIHILPPLPRRYHNLPAPVIHPPGSDPRTFMNPNPTASSMDVDPRVVYSRCEIVAKESDLTPSEHAGVSLSEAITIMSTTSDYSTNVVATKTVKDLVTTKTESKNKSTSFINHNVTCNSEMTLKKHMEGKIDLKNTQNPTISSNFKQETSSFDVLDQYPAKKKKINQDLDFNQVSTAIKQVTQPSVANDTLDKDSKKKNQDLLQKTSAFRSLFTCDIPEPGREYPKIVTVEMDESAFKNGVLNLTSTGRAPVQPSNVDIKNKHVVGEEQKRNLNGSEKKVTPSVKWCEVCKIICSSNDYDTHLSGKKHIKNLQKSEKILPSTITDYVTARPAESLKLTKGEVVNPNEGNSTRCELCGVCCTSIDLLNQHIIGKKHQKNLKKKQCVMSSTIRVAKTPSPEPMIEEGEVVFSERSKRKANETSVEDFEEGEFVFSEMSKQKAKEASLTSVEDGDNTKRQKMNEEEGCGVFVICKACNVVCNGLMAFKTHTCRL